jgi:N-acetylneuraminic acid mutarotase
VNGPVLDLHYEYNFLNGTWRGRKSALKRIRHTACTINNKIYVLGGYNGYGTSNGLDVYDPSSDTWTTKNPYPVGVQSHSAVAINGKLYVYGGAGNAGNALGSLYEYTPATDTWKALASSTPRRYHAAAVVGDKMYVTGGRNSTGSVVYGLSMYDPLTNKWTDLAGMPNALQYHTAFSINGKLYVYGGGSVTATIIYVYDPVTNAWDIVDKPAGPNTHHSMAAVVYGNKMYVFGGVTEVGVNNGLSEYTP